MQDVYKTLQLNSILEDIAFLSHSEKAKEDILNIKMFSSKEELKQELEELKEMSSLISRYSSLPFSKSVNMLHIIELAKKSGLLSPLDLYTVREDILTSYNLLAYFNKVDSSYINIRKYIDNFKDLSSLEKEIKRCITPSITVSDNASDELKQIRNELKKLEASLASKVASISLNYSEYLSNEQMTIRDGHFVLPVKTVNKNKVLGVIYDISSSGNTTFIEPLEIVQINNDIASKKILEAEEIRKILKRLTSLVLLQEEEVRNNNEIIARLDFLSSKATYGLDNEMNIMDISNEKEIFLMHARHPLIDKKKVVYNDYLLSKDRRIVVISGPNAGGKTVTIKTVGLLTLMHQCGLMVPASEGRLSYFNNIYLDIGDNQSINESLSTFSAHMSQISEIVKVVSSSDLVLLDELGTGTDPKEGESIAIGVIKYLESKGPLCLISSHYSGVKEYGFLSKNVENSSLLFDEEKLMPTYIYKSSFAGKSYGIEVAERYGLKEEIIESAKSYLAKQDDSSIGELTSILQKKVDEVEKLKRELDIKSKELEKEVSRLEAEKNNLKHQKEKLLESVKAEKEEIIENAKASIDEIMASLSKGEAKLHEVIEAKKKIDNLKDEVDVITFNEEIKENDYISIPSLNLEGQVKRLKGNKATVISNEGLTFEVDVSRLHKVSRNNKPAKVKKDNHYDNIINTNVGLELNIIGMRREEAKTALIKYLDNCRLKHLKTVRIIHGFGSGILRNMVHEYLKTQSDLTYKLGDMYEGGGGATVVTFND